MSTKVGGQLGGVNPVAQVRGLAVSFRTPASKSITWGQSPCQGTPMGSEVGGQLGGLISCSIRRRSIPALGLKSPPPQIARARIHSQD